jgi:hypothetical protein
MKEQFSSLRLEQAKTLINDDNDRVRFELHAKHLLHYTDINENKILVTRVVQFSRTQYEKNKVYSALWEIKYTDMIRKIMTLPLSYHFIY